MVKSNALYVFAIAILFSANLFGQKANNKITITGVVINSKQEPAEGALIFVDGVKTGYVTDNQGRYKIYVSTKAKKVSVLSSNYESAEAEINGRTSIEFSLTGIAAIQKGLNNNKQSDEVEVGYGKMKKNEISSSVNMTEIQNSKYSSYSSIFAILNEMPGVWVNGTKVVIKSSTKLGGNNQPLYVIDGIIVNRIDDISPNIIKSISILNGPSTSVYGLRGGNGVIIITTFRGSDKK